MSRLFVLFSFLLVANIACAEASVEIPNRTPDSALRASPAIVADSTTAALFAEAMAFAEAENLRAEPLGVIMQRMGERFDGAPYVAGMLDAPEQETLITRLDAFDCVLFVESALALAQSVQAGDDSFDGYTRRLEALRYRDGEMDGYCSRLHYFSEWIRDNQRRGQVENLTEALGGVRLDKTLDFMSSNRGSYPRFAENDSLFQEVRAMEADLAEIEVFHIPQDEISSVYDRLRAGDIIATSTYLDGLDVTHTGLAYDHGDGTFGFLHASTAGGVTVSPDLQDYIQGNRVQTGIVVVRPL